MSGRCGTAADCRQWKFTATGAAAATLRPSDRPPIRLPIQEWLILISFDAYYCRFCFAHTHHHYDHNHRNANCNLCLFWLWWPTATSRHLWMPIGRRKKYLIWKVSAVLIFSMTRRLHFSSFNSLSSLRIKISSTANNNQLQIIETFFELCQSHRQSVCEDLFFRIENYVIGW